MQLININEAAQFSGRSIQTIRRMIKRKKIHVKRQKTPQGFNYLIIKESLDNYINQVNQAPIQEGLDTRETSREHRSIETSEADSFKTEVERFNTTIQKMIEQNERDKANFFNLIKTFQERVITLEHHIKLLEAPRKSWWQIWN